MTSNQTDQTTSDFTEGDYVVSLYDHTVFGTVQWTNNHLVYVHWEGNRLKGHTPDSLISMASRDAKIIPVYFVSGLTGDIMEYFSRETISAEYIEVAFNNYLIDQDITTELVGINIWLGPFTSRESAEEFRANMHIDQTSRETVYTCVMIDHNGRWHTYGEMNAATAIRWLAKHRTILDGNLYSLIDSDECLITSQKIESLYAQYIESLY